MKFSVAPSLQRVVEGKRILDLDGFLAESKLAEKLGYFASYTGEKHSGDTSYTTNPTLACAVGLSKTERLKFCTGVTVLPLHHPVSVAEDAALLDGMFPGRFRLTTGAGYFHGDYAPFGVSLKERGKRMEAGMAAINAHRHGTGLTLEEFWRGQVPQRDPSLGEDRLEVFMGAWSIPGVKRTARTADGWLTDPIRSGRWVAKLAEVYREECAKLGKEPRIALLREAWVDATDAAARSTYGDSVLGYHRVYFRRGNAYDPQYDPWVKDVTSEEQLTLDHVLPDRVLCGSAQTWIEQIEEWQELFAPEEIVLRLRHFEGPPLDRTLEAIERVASEVMPKFAK